MQRLLVGLAAVLLSGACAPPVEDPIRIAVLMFSHETCTFCPGEDTEVSHWEQLSAPLTGESLLGADRYVGGFTTRAREFGDVELVPLTSPISVFGGSSRPWNSEAAFNHFLDTQIEELEAAMPVDAVYLSLHGAMAVRNVPRPEAEIARRVREVVGPAVPIAGTFDLHGNEDEEFLRWANFAFVTKRFPHYDDYIQGERAARALRLTVRGEYDPTTATRKPGVITPTVFQWTGAGAPASIMERARRWEAREDDVYVSVFFGYPWSDVPDVGATVHVMTNGDRQLADHVADDMSDYIWRVREEFASGTYPLPGDAARLVAEALAAGASPVAVGDYSDRPGDATHILKAFEAAGLTNVLYATITSPMTLDALEAAGASAGDAFDMEIGGFTPSGGAPHRIQGEVAYFDEGLGYDRIAAITWGDGNMVLLVPTYEQIMFPETIRFGPVDPDDFDVIVVKSRAHFRRGFDETGYAKTILVVEAPEPFVGTTFLDALPYENVDLSRLYPYGTPEGR
ncbi:MAG: M81 family metallopeptidase [Gemmatimonadota bacterium]|nr:M81 family metallopeptidase [Gemmatimonadota bacterium]